MLALSGCGADWFPETASVANFSFTPATDVAVGSTQVSDPVTVKVLTGKAPAISVSGGDYSVNGGDFTTAPGLVNDGDSVRVRHTASPNAATPVSTTLTIAGKSGDFTSTTTTSTATAFAFTPVGLAGVTPSTTATSSSVPITFTGLATAPISVKGGEYSIDGNPFTSENGRISSGQTVVVRHTTANGTNTVLASTTLTVADKSATFATTTKAVLAQTLSLTGTVGSLVSGSLPMVVIPGRYDVVFETTGSITGGYTLVPADAAADTYSRSDENQANFAAGQVVFFQDFAPDIAGDVNTTTIKVDGVPIVFKVTAK